MAPLMNLAHFASLALILPALAAPASAGAQQSDPSLLTVERIYGGDEFKAEEVSAQWLKDGSAYTTLEDADGSDGRNIVRHDPATSLSKVIVSAAELTPPGESEPLEIDGYSWSKGIDRQDSLDCSSRYLMKTTSLWLSL